MKKGLNDSKYPNILRRNWELSMIFAFCFTLLFVSGFIFTTESSEGVITTTDGKEEGRNYSVQIQETITSTDTQPRNGISKTFIEIIGTMDKDG